MADNKYTGDVAFELSGKPLTLCYKWDAIAQMQTTLGSAILQDIFKDPNPELVAKMLLAGLKKHHPEVTLEEIMEASPPIIPVLQIIDRAMAYAYYGADGVPTEKKS